MSLPGLASFDTIFAHLTTQRGYPILRSCSPYPHDPSLAHSISSLAIHPTREAILHILNSDFPSAHFLCRHMQNAPAWEDVYIHGLLHRVEGDYSNAESWYREVVESDPFKRCWPGDAGLRHAISFIRHIESFCEDNVGGSARTGSRMQQKCGLSRARSFGRRWLTWSLERKGGGSFDRLNWVYKAVPAIAKAEHNCSS
ncbi:hypothetical protein M433DRAFT_155491 [Acidomyces richmondensis BFW]|nr:hypothetical protein M433DRAFT_155491 [Acidomyces richmondensis BFW]